MPWKKIRCQSKALLTTRLASFGQTCYEWSSSQVATCHGGDLQLLHAAPQVQGKLRYPAISFFLPPIVVVNVIHRTTHLCHQVLFRNCFHPCQPSVMGGSCEGGFEPPIGHRLAKLSMCPMRHGVTVRGKSNAMLTMPKLTMPKSSPVHLEVNTPSPVMVGLNYGTGFPTWSFGVAGFPACVFFRFWWQGFTQSQKGKLLYCQPSINKPRSINSGWLRIWNTPQNNGNVMLCHFATKTWPLQSRKGRGSWSNWSWGTMLWDGVEHPQSPQSVGIVHQSDFGILWDQIGVNLSIEFWGYLALTVRNHRSNFFPKAFQNI